MRRRLSSHRCKTPAAEASVKAARSTARRVSGRRNEELYGRRSAGYGGLGRHGCGCNYEKHTPNDARRTERVWSWLLLRERIHMKSTACSTVSLASSKLLCTILPIALGLLSLSVAPQNGFAQEPQINQPLVPSAATPEIERASRADRCCPETCAVCRTADSGNGRRLQREHCGSEG
jgi:hypothetical protein